MGFKFPSFWSRKRPTDEPAPLLVMDPPEFEKPDPKPSVLLTGLNLAFNRVSKDLPEGWRIILSMERGDEAEMIVEILSPGQVRFQLAHAPGVSLEKMLLDALQEIKIRSQK